MKTFCVKKIWKFGGSNMLLTFCQMESCLLKRQIDALKEKFIREGGFRENPFRQRIELRKSKRLGIIGGIRAVREKK
jgi:four helix bundle suffix protein